MDAGARSTSRRRTASDQVHVVLLEAAQDVLDREGLARVTVRAVAREADVAPMGVYNRFGSKEGLLRALAVRALDDLGSAVAVDPSLEAEQRFRQACMAYRQFALAHPQRYELIFGGGGPVAQTGSEASVYGHAAFEVLIELVEGVISPKALGRFANSAEAAQMVWTAIHGAVHLELGGIGQVSGSRDIYERLLDVLVRGLQ
ncbi:TetR/AcrR family transcriptional regulator [Streptomyces chartreusis]|uniref:TetR/AcrR family transcriptional regulator n=1 Tax=Streptomyces chartreusis TaxID=1969 RepID=UPI002F909AB0|nr:TetR/AcrR family transcriptional regulator [Streptomyces chartreusis]WTA33389.1 TetR/AcrR family transcriptional regulator [Streptomyces chartreusis]